MTNDRLAMDFTIAIREPVMKHLSKAVFLFAITILVSACQTKPVIETNYVFDSTAQQELAINARQFEIIDNWQMPIASPYVEHELSPTPSQKVIEWATDNLRPLGGSGELILNISEASVQLEKLPPAEGLLNSLKDNQETRIRVTLAAQLLWIQPVGNQQGRAELAAKTTQTLPESSTPKDYDIAIQNNLNKAIALIDEQAREKIMEIEGMILP